MSSPFTLTIDWLSFTLPTGTVKDTMAVLEGEWTKSPSGFRGYPHKAPMMTQRYAHHYPESLRGGVEILDRRRRPDTKLTTVSGLSEVAVLQVVEKMVGDTGIEPVASSV